MPRRLQRQGLTQATVDLLHDVLRKLTHTFP